MRGSIKGGAGNQWEFFSVRNVAEKFAFRGSLPLVKCVTVWMPMLTHIQASHTPAGCKIWRDNIIKGSPDCNERPEIQPRFFSYHS